VNLFVGSDTKINLGKNEVGVKMETGYPLNGNVKISISTRKPVSFTFHIRRPGWSHDIVVPGNLYQYATSNSAPPAIIINVNGIPVAAKEENGYFSIDRVWKNGDVVDYKMAMEIRKVVSREEIKANTDRIALQRGPLVYCIEGADNNGKAWNIILPENTVIEEKEYSVLNEKVIALTAKVPTIIITDDGNSLQTVIREVTAIPYYTWCNRGSNPMQVWLPEKIKDVKVNY
jgi:DUF1680 family protein